MALAFKQYAQVPVGNVLFCTKIDFWSPKIRLIFLGLGWHKGWHMYNSNPIRKTETKNVEGAEAQFLTNLKCLFLSEAIDDFDALDITSMLMDKIHAWFLF